MGAFAELYDVELDYGTISTDLAPKVDLLINRAEAQLALVDPDLAARVNAGEVSAVLVTQVVCEMVVAVLRNPEGIQSSTETVGPFSGSRTFSDAASGRLVVTRRHRQLLGLPPAGAFTVNPIAGLQLGGW